LPDFPVSEIPFGFRGQDTDALDDHGKIIRAVAKLGGLTAASRAQLRDLPDDTEVEFDREWERSLSSRHNPILIAFIILVCSGAFLFLSVMLSSIYANSPEPNLTFPAITLCFILLFIILFFQTRASSNRVEFGEAFFLLDGIQFVCTFT
jgi:hypothetical protein